MKNIFCFLINNYFSHVIMYIKRNVKKTKVIYKTLELITEINIDILKLIFTIFLQYFS